MWSATARSGCPAWKGCRVATCSQPSRIAARCLIRASATPRISAFLETCFARLSIAGVGGSKSDARRQLQQGAVRANGVAVGADQGLEQVPLLHDRYLLLRKGKRSYHLVEISPGEG